MFNKKVCIIIICAAIGLTALSSISLDKIRSEIGDVIGNSINTAIDKATSGK